jgi:hypothetical protein
MALYRSVAREPAPSTCTPATLLSAIELPSIDASAPYCSAASEQRLLRQYLYFFEKKFENKKLHPPKTRLLTAATTSEQRLLRQYWYFCTSKASKVGAILLRGLLSATGTEV